ncbi:MAG: phosphatidylserine/phosphatidylglycerophosphate/cardiolipin synthase family protein [bacterium]|nr:phosphatidylserine/phosphatidylglycerophosphate/cardiolipin synthase family protein [bacterium]
MIALIRASRREIRMWAYGFDEPEVIDALVAAGQRGVSVSVTGSPDRNYELLEQAFRRQGVFLRLAIRRRSGLQHIKLAVFDQAIAFTGTGNFTRSGFFYNHNAFLEIRITGAHRDSFAALLARLESDENAAKNRFLEPGTPIAERTPVFRIAPGVRAILSPGDGRLIQSRLVQAIRDANHKLRFLIFSFTDPVIAAALGERARDGIPLQGIVDDPGNRGELDLQSATGRLNQNLGFAPAEIYLEGNRRVFAEGPVFHGGHLHHKTLLVDDATILTGSYNWSLSARDRNLEILLIIDDLAVAADFRREFERVLRDAVLQGRPPFAPGPEAASLAKFDAAERSVCLPGGALRHDLTVFSGVGPYFRAYHFAASSLARAKNTADGQACLNFEDISPTSTGINTGSRYLLPPVSSAEAMRPCASAGECVPIDVYRVDLDEGWLWIRHDSRHAGPTAGFSEMRVWNRSGFQPENSLQPGIALRQTETPGFYRFTPPTDPGSDALLFLSAPNAPNAPTAVACARYGSRFEPALREFLAAFAWEQGAAPACARGE